MTDRCIYCGAEATRWCDLVIGFTDPDGDGLFNMDGTHEILSCDSPLCAHHAVHQGLFHVSGSAGWSESIDHCCGHAEEGWLLDRAGEWMRNPDRFEPISSQEADRRRYRHRCLASGPLRLV